MNNRLDPRRNAADRHPRLFFALVVLITVACVLAVFYVR